jgi:hypothetical protein
MEDDSIPEGLQRAIDKTIVAMQYALKRLPKVRLKRKVDQNG